MKIIVDANSGDYAPLEVVKGSYSALNEYGLDILLVGDEDKIKDICIKENIDINKFEIVDCKEEIPMDEEPSSLLNKYKESSMAVCFKLLKENRGSALVSSGNTGALLVGGTFIIKRIKGVKRPALAPIIPSANNAFILMDAGANTDCKPYMLEQFAIMGSIYMNKILNVDNPKVGLLNIGSEESKGRDLEVDSISLLKNNSKINFTGNIEPRDVPYGLCDVVVTDGFTGNVVLKLMEGMGKTFRVYLKNIFYKNIFSKLSALIVSKSISNLKKKMDYKEYGGAVLMGVSKPVIKAHGSSNAKAIKNAIRQAKNFVDKNVLLEIEKSLNGE